MKKINCILSVLVLYAAATAQNKMAAPQSANTSLSNLVSPTSVNVSLLPKNKNHNLGSVDKPWKNMYVDSAVVLDGFRFLASKSGSGYYNTAIGAEALINNTSGHRNTANGYHAMVSNLTGIENTAIGTYAFADNTSGSQNLAEGAQALNFNTTGDGNTAIGTYALVENKSGSYNVAIGYSAGGFAKKLNYIVAVGANALSYLSDGGDGCTAVGDQAGFNNTTGNHNTYLGFHAGNTIETGNSNTIIGYGADVYDAGLTNTTALGNYTIAHASNSVRIGNGSVTSIGGAVGWTNFSDERIKTNIQQNVPGLTFINLLKPVTYNFDLNKEESITKRKTEEWNGKHDIEKIQFTGFLAQDVEAAAKKINYDFSGVDVPKDDKGLYSLRYSDFVVPLVKAVQELSKMNDAKDNIIQIQNNKIDNLESRLAKVEALLYSNLSSVNNQQSTLSSASLSQNNPNPFSNSTIISYSISQQFSSARIIITDKNGNLLKQINLSSNKGSVKVDASTLINSAYQYSLYVDEKLATTKTMIVLK